MALRRAKDAVTLEVGQKMFGLSTDRLTPGYNDMLHSLGALFEAKGIQVNLRPSPDEHRDGPPNSWLQKRRLAVAGEAIDEGRREGLKGGAHARGAGGSAAGLAPQALVQSMTYAETKDRARLIVTLSGEVPYAAGASDSSALLLVLHTTLAPDFHMPDIPEGSMLHRVSLDLSDENGSLFLISEPGPGVSCRARTLRKPFRIELLFEKEKPAAGAGGG
jgi:hypothetical protein